MKNFFLNNRYKLLFLILVIGIYMFVEPIKVNVNKAMVIMQNVDVELVREYILGFGVWAPIVSFILMILQSVVAPLPAFIITFANAAIFGWVYGAILSWSSAMAGAALCFFIARLLGRDAIEKLTSKSAVKKADDFFKDYGTYAVLIARLLPFISFDIVSYAAGLTGMRFWSFFIATGIGQLPATLIYSYIGGMLTGTIKMVVTGLLILFAVSTLIILLKKVLSKKSEATSEKAV
ncbi:MAG: TVP38/TMEM64 family protein [Clostridium sp.]|uniref:TVP38/TMEM64 family protein n=1 Tax=Clostridium sp. TaxID=1506 RepID=UPI002FCAC779